ncbi:polysaccharide deacetylase family protein [Sporosarcina cascadiensis]|uniref:polysaccharide deacetylase family protein n=1 Tax=Sporosarcina cascadiensis TaxID=2660747 RepID=UPI00129AA28B|nr:polysaccharide deacetylase family protein [Sporosarcina cascadiensis]
MKHLRLISIFICMGILFLGFSTKYFEVDAELTNTASASKTGKDPLTIELESFSQEHHIPAVDAKVDRVWKAIPGYNGLEVDIEASHKIMKANGKMDKSKVVYKETSPAVHLEDLGPHPIFKGNPDKPMVAFLINVAWGNEFIPEILDVLKENKTKVSFFFDGSWVRNNPDLAKMIFKDGHEIGNHAYSHPDLQRKSEVETSEELKRTNDIISKTLGIESPKWFGPPSGSFNQQTVEVASQLGMHTVLWTVDTVDWKKPATSVMVNRVVTQVENGSMILMHPTKPVAEGIGAMITQITEQGYRLGTVSELMSEKRVIIKKDGPVPPLSQ